MPILKKKEEKQGLSGREFEGNSNGTPFGEDPRREFREYEGDERKKRELHRERERNTEKQRGEPCKKMKKKERHNQGVMSSKRRGKQGKV